MEKFTNLYLFGFSSNNSVQLKRLHSILKTQVNGDNSLGLVLIHDGVIGTVQNGMIPEDLENILNLPVQVLAMKPDLKARGIPIERIHEKITVISYDELVDIMNNSGKLISWM
ncbi:MAG: sulfurtransferase complex subunit TusB [Candidatus Lokiarchaeota archaeon]